MTENIPIITVTCFRDLPMLNLQAQSINLYLDKSVPVYIVVNEDDPTNWKIEFSQHIEQYYKNHNLTILYRTDFEGDWNSWLPDLKNPWAAGWEIQQIIKLSIAQKLNCARYLVLDSQNFLIKSWTPEQYGLVNGKVPARLGTSSMPEDIYNDYLRTLKIDNPLHTIGKISICTPIFLNTDLVKHLIKNLGGEAGFSQWFKSASRVKSEFILYELWAEKYGGLYEYHYMVPAIEDWANPYLRDCRTEEEFSKFLAMLGVHKSNAWASINHRAWGNMTNNQYCALTEKLKDYELTPMFNVYRDSYVDLKI
jgi:hypothetical protein